MTKHPCGGSAERCALDSIASNEASESARATRSLLSSRTRGAALALLAVLSLPAGAQTMGLRLRGSQVVPPVTTAGSGSGTAVVNVGSGQVTISGSFANLGSSLTLAALHGPAAIGAGGSHVANLSFTGTTTGTFSGQVSLNASQVQGLLDGLYYVDLHTSGHSGGEIRGQILVQASAASRNAGTNPASYAASAPVLGAAWSATVDLTTTGHTLAIVFGFDGQASVALPAGQRLLCFDFSGNGEILGLAPQPGPLASFGGTVPDVLGAAGFAFSTQALHLGGTTPFALSNAQDLVLGL